MLESKQYSAFWYFFDCIAAHSFFDSSRKYLQQIVYCFTPEDTTDMTDKPTVADNQLNGLVTCTSRSTLKLVCWIAIATSLMLGQLN